jgi:hypothetical protein
MSFPSFSFFYKITSFYKKIRLVFLYSYYYKLHNVLFTNLYIRIYRYKLIQLEKKKKYTRYSKLKMNSFSDKFKKRTTNKARYSFNGQADQRRSFHGVVVLYSNGSFKNESYTSKIKARKRKPYVYINKFKDCGNQYNFDPFHLLSTYKLDTFDFTRTKRNIKKQDTISNINSFDSRLNTINFKYFNNYAFSLILDVFKQKNLKKDEFLISLKTNLLFMHNFLLFLKKRIIKLCFYISDFKRLLRSYVYKLNAIAQLVITDAESNQMLSYIKQKSKYFFSSYLKIINIFDSFNSKYKNMRLNLIQCKALYVQLLGSFKLLYNKEKKISIVTGKKKERTELLKSYEYIHNNLLNVMAKKMLLFNFNSSSIQKWEKRNLKDAIYLSMNKYLTLFRSYFKQLYMTGHSMNKAIVYIKATISNVYLYFIYNNKVLFKKSCGELFDIKKKERHFWRNVYPLVETLLPILVKYKALFKFPVISLYLNGSDSLCTPLLSRLRKHNKKFRRLVYFLFNELDYFIEKTLSLKKKYQQSYIFYPVYRLKFYAITDGFNRLSKLFFAINKVQDVTSWPYNGCKRKKKKNVR